MHILFLTDNFPPEVNAPASRTFEHCREWVKAGHQVTVITGAPNFPKGIVFEGFHNHLWHEEVISGIRVVRVWTYITANEGFIKRTLDYLSYMMSSFLASLFVRNIDLVVGTSPQFFTVCAAYMVSIFKRIPWVFELRDIWPESIRVVGAMQHKRTLNALEKLELFLYRKANAIVSVTHAFKQSLIRRGIDGGKIFVVTNGVDTDRFIPRKKDLSLLQKYHLQGKFVVGYIGTHGLAHALDTILDTAQALRLSSFNKYFSFIFIGDGATKARLKQRAYEAKLGNVIFIDSVSKDEVIRYWTLLDAAIIHLKKHQLFTTVIPSKLFECMASGIPVLHGVQGESAEIVQREEIGLLFEPENSHDLMEKLQYLSCQPNILERFKVNGPKAAHRYQRSTLALEMLEVFQQQLNFSKKN